MTSLPFSFAASSRASSLALFFFLSPSAAQAPGRATIGPDGAIGPDMAEPGRRIQLPGPWGCHPIAHAGGV
ncbi:hypothetical protein CP969_12540 [Streptomyces viridosporus T7A]|uniref:Uncharacterized protein n=1 Tax=Streptomyces viridosporus T7A TaxID=665577 RepID=A0ABX6AD98_STRVD|nr:hypothetical protein CP969_12540 [Streptomyces viridosporus T7A]